MAKYIKGKDGKFAGSIGAGKTQTPSPAPTIHSHASRAPDPDSPIPGIYDRYTQGTTTLTDTNGTVHAIKQGDLEAARWALSMGNCHSLALAVHEQTGYPLVAFYDDPAASNSDDDHIKHIAVLTPDGYVLDADGAMPLDLTLARTGWQVEEVGRPSDLAAALEEDSKTHGRTWQPLNPEAVQSFVAPVLERYRNAQLKP